MEPFSQEQLGVMYAEATAFNEEVEKFRQNGGNPADVYNDVYDDAGMVFAIWRKKRGGYSYMLVKGLGLCERIIATGIAEPVGQLAHAVPSAASAMMMAAMFDRNPYARWVYATRHDGVRVLGLE
ncbi:hypothetical protein [Methylobacterium sp. WL120]|uniref:hypothetical protein n=1 Tax=Methylobacterium sp. WL120 TaxID=2603887 RepID=UPI0011CADFEA|nr:hypothetical protein [Methylobacterium sp. WL120]TXM65409.1 hypothetical protein FV229_15675 [Methylobacterium sp. WL120]